MDQNERNGLQEIIDNALAEIAEETDEGFNLSKINLAIFCSKTGLTRSKARTLKKKGFKVAPHGRCGMKAEVTVLTGFTDMVDSLLREGVTNSSVCFERIKEKGYGDSLTTVKDYIAAHKHLVPTKRKTKTDSQGNRGRRCKTRPGECFQMDWGL